MPVSLRRSLAAAAALAQAPDGLRGPEAFASIQESRERSIALFTEAGKVLQHPRCVNCHPADDRPRQGIASRLHQPPRGAGKAITASPA